MSAFRSAFKAVRNRPKTTLFAAAVLYKAADVAANRWRRAVARERYTDDAKTVGEASMSPLARYPRYRVLVHPRAGDSDNREFFDKEVAPIFHQAAFDFEAKYTKSSESLKRLVTECDFNEFQGLIIVGGDGYCQEAVSALLQRPDAETARQRPIGFVPVGTSNTLMNGMIDTEDRNRQNLAHAAARGIVCGESRLVDVIEIEWEDYEQPTYALCNVSWGLFGGSATKGQHRRWPGTYRYEVAAFVAATWGASKHSHCTAHMQYKNAVGRWFDVGKVHLSSFIASVNPVWDLHDRMINKHHPTDSGLMTLAYTKMEEASLLSVFNKMRKMRHGEPFVEQDGVESDIVSEVKLTIDMPPRPALEPPPAQEEPEEEAVSVADTTAQASATSVEARSMAANEDATKPLPEQEWRHDCDMGVDGTNYMARSIHLRVKPQHVRVFTPARLPRKLGKHAGQ